MPRVVRMSDAPVAHASIWYGRPDSRDCAHYAAGANMFERRGKAKRGVGKRNHMACFQLRQQAGVECQEDPEISNCAAWGMAWSRHGQVPPGPRVHDAANIAEQKSRTLAPEELAGGLCADHSESSIRKARAGLEAAIRELLAPKVDSAFGAPSSTQSGMVSTQHPLRPPPGLELETTPKSDEVKVRCGPRAPLALPMYANTNTMPNYHAKPAEAIAELMSLKTLLADRLSGSYHTEK
mmetsp:Transcript_7430/g.20879  ORF Transcript_7430/g.20879 Transcript_7430/m.20879 type:complete len:238 (-) Transcript_7430:574-1287(-)